jgi:hypothetical protein
VGGTDTSGHRPGDDGRRTAVGPLVAVGALAAASAVVVAGPMALVRLAGNPLPGHLPGLDELAPLLLQPDDGTVLLWALGVTGWLAWAVIAGSLLLELTAQLTGRRAPGVLGWPQRLARLLVAAAIASITAPGVSHADTAPVPSLVHVVDRGDWMWHIAGRYLGDEHRYPEIAALNPHLADRYTAFPDHIRPGDTLRLPSDARDGGMRPHATGQVTQVGGGRAGGQHHGAPRPGDSAVPAPPAPSTDRSTDGGVAAPAATGGPPVESQSLAGGESDGRAAGPLLVGGMVAAVLFGAVAWHSGGARAYRRYRRVVTGAAGTPAEVSMCGQPVADVSRLDRALRALAASGSVPDVGAVWLVDGDIHLVLAGSGNDGVSGDYFGAGRSGDARPSPPPAPFIATDAGTWLVPASEELPAADGVAAPYPALVTVAAQPGRQLLIDLERHRMLTITGEPDRCGDLFRHLAAELAHHPWSDRVEVTLVGFPADQAELLSTLPAGRLRVATSLPEAVDQLRRRIAEPVADRQIARLLLVHEPTAADREALRALGDDLADAGHRCAVAVVVADGSGGGTAADSVAAGRADRGGRGDGHVTVTATGRLHASFLAGVGDLVAVRLPADLLGTYADLVGSAADPGGHPIPPAEAALRADTPVLPVPVLDRTVAGDLDGDLDRWRNAVGPRVAILGPVGVTAPGPAPTRRQRACREMVVFLAAAGRAGATAEEIIRHLWPQDPPPATVRTEVIADTRQWLGEDDKGRPWLDETDAGGRYRLRECVPVDWHLFCRLRSRARHTATSGDLVSALRLVRGAPLQDVWEPVGTRRSYGWLAGSPFAPEVIVAGVIDTAHELVECALACGDLERARWAVQRAWLADPDRRVDHPWRDLLHGSGVGSSA